MTDAVSAGVFAAGGVIFGVETNRPDFAARVGDAFRDLRVPHEAPPPVVFRVWHRGAAPPPDTWAVWRNEEPCEQTVTDGYVLAYLLWEITRLMFERTGDRVHLHGAAVVYRGRALVLAGRSGAGKSTLAGWLTHRGWGFLTDEAALVDLDGLTVAPFWRPIGVRRPGPLDVILGEASKPGEESAEILLPASTIGSLAPAAPLAGIAFARFTPHEPAALSALSPAAALVELTEHFPGLVELGRTGFRRLADLVRAVPAHALRFSDLDEAEEALRRLARPA